MLVVNHSLVTLPGCRKTLHFYLVVRQLLLVWAIHFVLLSAGPASVSAQIHHGSMQSHSEPTTPLPIRKHIRHSGGHSESNHLGKHHGHTPPSDPVYPDDPDYDLEAADLLPRPGTYIPSNCSSCIRREELRKRNLEVIKDQILSKLGMRTAPNMTGRYPPRIPPLNHLLDLYGMQGDAPQKGFQTGPVYDEEEDDFHARTEKVISFAQTLPRVQDALDRAPSTIFKGMKSIYFKFSDKVTRSKVDKAHLWIYLRPSSSSSTNKDATAAVHLHTVARVPEDESPVLNKIRTTKVGLEEKGGWVPLEVKKVVSDWFRQPDENLGFVVQANDSSDKSLVVTDPDESDGSLIPFMEVVTTDSRKHRTKRTIGLNCDENSAETRCCRYPLTVDFVEFGWDWIIAPKKYEANYCSGECPYIFLQKYPHTHIVQQANPAGTAGPCCAPRKMSPISMLYFDNEFNIIYGLLPGMVVDRCGCS